MQGDNRKSTRHARIRKFTYYDRLKYLKSDPSKDAEGTYLIPFIQNHATVASAD
jgi:hypothetical protein